MQTKKMSLANIQGKLSRSEMKNIMAGGNTPGEGAKCGSACSGACTYKCGTTTYDDGNCRANSSGTCYCVGGC